jgi:hypothetical protein
MAGEASIAGELSLETRWLNSQSIIKEVAVDLTDNPNFEAEGASVKKFKKQSRHRMGDNRDMFATEKQAR